MIEFAQPAALWSALAIGLPVIAHMAYRRVTEKFYFSSLRFIRPSQIPRTGKRTPSDIPLLLLRILLFIILTLLLADPYWKSPSTPSLEGQNIETLIAIDLSPSMHGWGGIEEAKKKALTILEKEKSEVGFITFGSTILNKIEIGNDRDSIKSQIENLLPDWSRGNAQILLDQMPNMFSEKATARKLFILSDFQESDWQTAYTDLQNSGINYELIKVGETSNIEGKRQNNLSVLEARAVPAGPGKIRIWTVIRNWDDTNKTAEVELIAGGKVKAKNIVSIAPYGSVQTQFVIKEGDFSSAKVQLVEEDAFTLDNERSLWLKAPPARRFGFWMPEFENDETDQEKSFLKTAVASSGDNGWNRWEWDQDRADSLRLGDDQLEVQLLMILGLGKWFEEEQLGGLIEEYISKGGVALITPGEPFSSAVSILKSNQFFDYNFVRVAGGAVQSKNPFRIGALEPSSALAEVFAGKAARDLYLSAIHRFGIMKPSNGSEGIEVPLRDREGRPLALVKPFDGGGRLVFLPFRMNTTWTDLPLRNSFLPLLMELTQGSQVVSRSWPVIEPGEELIGIAENFTAKQPGTFRFQEQWVEVVLSSAESTPNTLSMNELTESLGGPGIDSASSIFGGVDSEEESNPLWMWFAILATTLLIIEMLWSRPRNSSHAQKQIHA
ncbi:MAG: BatA domain-containing protein [Opitutales bacterium]|nr:BatA domain-containing protein [Opitutales bacterium]